MTFRTKLLRVMRLTAFIMLVFALHTSANVRSQQVSYQAKEAKLETVFAKIKQQTGYLFIYNDRDIAKAKPVTLNLKNVPLKAALDEVLKEQPLSYEIKANTVFIVAKKEIVPVSEQPVAPPVDVRGRVVNEKGDPLAGVSVLVKGTKRGTSTNENGEFELKGLSEDAVLQFSGVNIEAYETKLNGRSELNFTARAKISKLEDVVVSKGYYSTKQKMNTGNVVKVDAAQITNQPISNPILGLEGLVPGLLVTQSNGLPGSRFTVLLRGQNSIQNGNSPLYVIDGVPFLSDNDALTQLNGMLSNSPFNSIDPNDIESIEILKDADATAIYGSRGANGVILITTKIAKAEQNSLSVSFSKGWGKTTRTMDRMNTSQYLAMRKEAFQNDGITPTLSDAPDLLSWDQTRNMDWKKFFIGGTAQIYNAQVRYSGGNQFTKFSIGTGYYRETTVFPTESGDKKNTLDININHKSSNGKFNLSFIASYGIDIISLPANDINRFTSLPPNSYALKNQAGSYIWSEAGYSGGNPLAAMEQISKTSTDRLTANSTLSYRPNGSLEFKINLGYNKVSTDEKSIAPITSQDPAFAPEGYSVFGNNYIKTWIVEPQASYKFSLLTKLKFETLLGTTFQQTNSERGLITASGYTNDALLGSVAAAPFKTVTNGKLEYSYAAIFGRVGLDFDNKYILNITGRRDGSSRFGPEHRFANFGAVGAAWIFSNELFIKKNIHFLSFGKVRASYGLTGNDQIGNYQYFDTYRSTGFPYQGQPGLAPSRLFNSNYSWEENRKTEIALELGFIQDRVSLNINYYSNKSNNQIIRYSLPSQTGFDNILMNFPGEVENKGIEGSINAVIVKNKNFSWSSSFNITHNENNLVSFPGLSTSSYSTTYIVGRPLNAFQGLQFKGVSPQTGIYEFEDLNKDGQINNKDFYYYGTTDPKYYGGFSNSFTYKGIQLAIALEFRNQLGRDLIYSNSGLIGDLINQPVYALQRWQKPGDVMPYQRYSQDYTGVTYLAATNLAQSDAILTDASYVRLRNVMLSYTLKSPWLKKMNKANVKIFCQMQNLFTITKYKGNDPETQSLSSLPPLKMITVGIQSNF